MDPACDGYSFWTVVDVVVAPGKNYSAQGLFNAFWITHYGDASMSHAHVRWALRTGASF